MLKRLDGIIGCKDQTYVAHDSSHHRMCITSWLSVFHIIFIINSYYHLVWLGPLGDEIIQYTPKYY